MSPSGTRTFITLRPRVDSNRQAYIERCTNRSVKRRIVLPPVAKRTLPNSPPTPIRVRSPFEPPAKRFNNNKVPPNVSNTPQITFGPSSTQADTQSPPASFNETIPLDADHVQSEQQAQAPQQPDDQDSEHEPSDQSTSNEAGTKEMESPPSSESRPNVIVKYFGAQGNPLPDNHSFDRSNTNVGTAASVTSNPDHDGSLAEHVIIAVNGDDPNVIDDIIYFNNRHDPADLIQAYQQGILNLSTSDEGINMDITPAPVPPVVFGPPTPPSDPTPPAEGSPPPPPSPRSSSDPNISQDAVKGSDTSSNSGQGTSSSSYPSSLSTMSTSTTTSSSTQHDVSMASIMDTTTSSGSSLTLSEAAQIPQHKSDGPEGRRGGGGGGGHANQ